MRRRRRRGRYGFKKRRARRVNNYGVSRGGIRL